MDKIINFENYLILLSNFKKNNKRYITNDFIGAKKIKELINNRKLSVEKNNCCFCFLIQKSEFSMLYFYTKSIENIIIPNSIKIVCEIIGRQSEINRQSNVLIDRNLVLYSKYHRMVLKKGDSILISEDKKISNQMDHQTIKSIYNIILKEFDKFSDRIPNHDEFNYYVKNNYFIIKRDNFTNDIKGFLMYDIKGTVSFIEYIVVLEKYRGKNIAKELLDTYHSIMNNKVKKFQLWVNEYNLKAIKLYKKYNYKKDNLVKYVMIDRRLIMRKKVIEILCDVNSDVLENSESNLIQSGIIDSFDIMNIVCELENVFNIELDAEDVVAENFETVDDIVEMIVGKRNFL
jgi:ribosomal protein S18 acetylase RimI-like enzyme